MKVYQNIRSESYFKKHYLIVKKKIVVKSKLSKFCRNKVYYYLKSLIVTLFEHFVKK